MEETDRKQERNDRMTVEDVFLRDGKSLKETLVELSAYYYAMEKNLRGKKGAYQAGKADGALEMLDMLIFLLYGGRFAFENWLKNIGKSEEERRELADGVFPAWAEM